MAIVQEDYVGTFSVGMPRPEVIGEFLLCKPPDQSKLTSAEMRSHAASLHEKAKKEDFASTSKLDLVPSAQSSVGRLMSELKQNKQVKNPENEIGTFTVPTLALLGYDSSYKGDAQRVLSEEHIQKLYVRSFSVFVFLCENVNFVISVDLQYCHVSYFCCCSLALILQNMRCQNPNLASNDCVVNIMLDTTQIKFKLTDFVAGKYKEVDLIAGQHICKADAAQMTEIYREYAQQHIPAPIQYKQVVVYLNLTPDEARVVVDADNARTNLPTSLMDKVCIFLGWGC